MVMWMSDRHQKQRGKNLALLCVLLVMIALVYGITIMRMGAAGG